jgi:hypothetical protein
LLTQIILQIEKLLPASALENQLPRALSNREVIGGRLVNRCFAHRAFRGAQQVGQDAHTVLGGVVGQLRADNVRASGKQVVEANGVIAN